nr:hypothetical protein [Lachnospiraceae bacterium]
SMFTGPDGQDYVSLMTFDNENSVGDVICGTYDAETETDENGIDWTYFTVHDVYTGSDVALGAAEVEDALLFFDAEGNTVEGSYLDSSETITYMGSAAAAMME